MEVMLENYAMSQQRALQAMRDRCNKLKKKNEKLEEKINRSEHVHETFSFFSDTE